MTQSTPLSSEPIRVVLFDLDDTLLDTLEAVVRLQCHWYSTRPCANRPASEEEFVAAMLEPLPEPFNPRDVYVRMLNIWPGCFDSVDEGIAAHQETMPRMVRLDSRVEAMLRDLRASGVPTGVVTNGPTEEQWNKMRNTGIADLVDAAVVSQEFGANKPDPSIFRRALDLIGAEVSETIFVGDNAVADIGGAHGVGMRTAWMRHGREWPMPSYHPTHILDAVWEARGLVGV